MNVVITLSGPLKGFERLRKAIGDVPYYEVDNLIRQIDDAARALRGRTTVPEPEIARAPGVM